MYLKQLYGGFAEWRTFWNQTVLPYLRSQKLVAGHGVRISQRPTGTVIEAVDAGGRGVSQTGGVMLAAVVTMPTGGVGAGAVQLATPTASGGVILASGASIPVVMPYIDGAN